MKKNAPIYSLLCLFAAPALAAPDLDGLVNNQLCGLVDTYKGINAHPELGVMHACGHDVHVATMIGTARSPSWPRTRS
jgi:hypothetical protein